MSEYIIVKDKDTLMQAWAAGQGPNKTKAIINGVVIEDDNEEGWSEQDLIGYLQRIEYEDGSGFKFMIGMYINYKTDEEQRTQLKFVTGYLDLSKTKVQDENQTIIGDNNIQVSGNITLNDSVVIRD